jgi:hypothetical protein
MIDLRFKEDFLPRVETRMAQPIATDGSIEKIGLFLSNHSSDSTVASLTLHACNGIHDYMIYAPDHALASAEIEVAPGTGRWVTWHLPATVSDLAGGVSPGRYVRLELAPNPDLQWHQARTCVACHPAMYEVALGRMRRLQHGVSLGVKVSPEQRVFGADQLLSGVTRPHGQTNLWCSDPSHPLPATLELSWEEEVTIRSVELTFAGNLLREYHAYHPFYRDPQTVSDYTVLAESDDQWKPLVGVSGNYQRRRVHTFDEQVSTTCIRLRMDATNGERAVAVYEIRVY